MSLRKLLLVFAVAALFGASVGHSQAAAPPPAPAAAAGIGVGVVGGAVGVGVALVIYDLWLKANGYKNWDGSPKVAKPARKARR